LNKWLIVPTKTNLNKSKISSESISEFKFPTIRNYRKLLYTCLQPCKPGVAGSNPAGGLTLLSGDKTFHNLL